MRRRWGERTDGDFHGSPFSGPVGNNIAADAGVEFRKKTFVEGATGKFLSQDSRFQMCDAFSEERR